MNILLISDRHPCPPKNGLYVPLYEFVLRLRHMPGIRIDLALPMTETHSAQSDLYFQHIHYLPLVHRTTWQRFIDLVFFKRPPYAMDMIIPTSCIQYDVIIATPDGFVETLRHMKNILPMSYTMLWINELYSTVSLGQILNFQWTNLKKIVHFPLLMLKHAMIYLHEKRYLSTLDAVIVQTPREAARFHTFLSASCTTRAFVFSNPMKDELLHYTVEWTASVILIHAPRHIDEIRAFVRAISMYIQDNQLHMMIRICTEQTRLYQDSFAELASCVQVMGYQEHLIDVYHQVFCAIVFTRQRFGMVNRIKEAMTAGVPVISYPETCQTVGHVEDQKHVLYAKNINQFVKRTVTLINNREQATSIGMHARQFILANEIYGPDQFIHALFTVINKPVDMSIRKDTCVS